MRNENLSGGWDYENFSGLWVKKGTIEDYAKIVAGRIRGGADLAKFYPSDCARKHDRFCTTLDTLWFTDERYEKAGEYNEKV